MDAIDGKRQALRTLLWFLPMALAVVATTAMYGQNTRHRDLTVRSSRTLTAVLVGKASLTENLKHLVRSLHFLHRSFDTNRLCDDPKPYQTRNFENFSRNFLMAKPDYDQVRWIDKDGKERVRLIRDEGKPSLVPSDALQNKGTKAYFTDTMALAPGNIYISPLDLNMEHGKLEQPYKPMLRIGAPVTNAGGQKCGIILLNYLGTRLIHGFVQATAPLDAQVMLLNHAGYYLRSSRADQEWGFMTGRKDLTLGHRFPAAWQRISAADRGQFMDAHGLWTFETINIAQYVQGMGAYAPGSEHDQWKVVSHLPMDMLYANSDAKRQRAWIVTAAMLALLLFLSWRLARAGLTREALERKIAAQAAAYEDLYNFAPCGYHSIDKDGKLIRINQTELDWLGYTRDELIGQHFTIMHANPDVDLIEEKLKALHTHQSVHDMEFELRRKDGTSFPVSLSASPVYDDQGRFLFSRSMLFDLRYRRGLEDRLKVEARRDTLTGLHNRRSFYESAHYELSRSRRTGSPLALLMFDIDFFKKINDRYGHDIGDEVLKSCSRTSSESLRSIDILGRWGGEEFIVLLPGIDAQRATEVAERLRHDLAAAEVRSPDGQPISYTVSIGVTGLLDDTDDIEAMFKRADKALYAAKHAGRNCIKHA